MWRPKNKICPRSDCRACLCTHTHTQSHCCPSLLLQELLTASEQHQGPRAETMCARWTHAWTTSCLHTPASWSKNALKFLKFSANKHTVTHIYSDEQKCRFLIHIFIINSCFMGFLTSLKHKLYFSLLRLNIWKYLFHFVVYQITK